VTQEPRFPFIPARILPIYFSPSSAPTDLRLDRRAVRQAREVSLLLLRSVETKWSALPGASIDKAP